MKTPEMKSERAIDARPYQWAVWCRVGGAPKPFANVIESRSWSEDGRHIWFLLGTHNFMKARPDEELELVPTPHHEHDRDDTAEFLAKRPRHPSTAWKGLYG